MTIKSLMATLAISLLAVSSSWADLEPWKDFDISDSVWSVTTIKVAPNMQNAYLEGIAKTWVKGNEVSKELGHIEGFWIYRSELAESGDFNLMLVVKFADTSDLAPNKERYNAWIKAVGRKAWDESTEYSQKNYPAMREITGEYRMREITLK